MLHSMLKLSYPYHISEVKKLLTPSAKLVEIFYSYHQKDEQLQQELEKHLSILKRIKLVNTWYVGKIYPGMEQPREISAHLARAQVILLLISPDYLASDYCYGFEVRQAMERHEAGEACVIPILLRSVEWDGAPFSKLAALPTNGKPVTIWDDRDSAFADIAKGIRESIENLLKKPFRKKSNIHKNITDAYFYDVVLSYASEDRIYAETLADSLRRRAVNVYCYSQEMDQERKFDLWGKNLDEYILDIYLNQARYCVIFISRHYAAKKWTRREKEVALLRFLNEQQDYIFPIRLDDTELPDISSIFYLRWNEDAPESMAELLAGKLREISQILPYPHNASTARESEKQKGKDEQQNEGDKHI